MKIVEDSDTRLILKEGAVTARITAVICMLIGIGIIVAGTQTHKSAVVFYGLGALFAIVGLLLLIFSKSDVVIADKVAKQLSVTFRSLKDRAGQTQQTAFSDVMGVVLSQQYIQSTAGNMNNNGGNGGISFGTSGIGNTNTEIRMTLAVQLKDGNTWTVASEQHQMGLNLGISKNGLAATGQRLAAAVGVQFQQVGAATPGQVIGAVVDKLRGTAETPPVASADGSNPTPAPEQPNSTLSNQ